MRPRRFREAAPRPLVAFGAVVWVAAVAIMAVLATPGTSATAAAQAPTIFVPPPAPAIAATPQSAPAGTTLAIDGTSIRWKSCQLNFDQQAVVSMCDVNAGTLTGTLQIPMQATEGSHQITACNQSCAATQVPGLLTTSGCCATASTTVTVVAVVPTPTPTPTPTLVAVPSLQDLSLNAALATLHARQLLGGYSTAMPHGHVTAQRTAAGTLVPLHSRVYFTLQPWAVVPAIRTFTVDQARSALGTHLVLSTTGSVGVVGTQHPDAGVEVPYGTVVSAELVAAATTTHGGRIVDWPAVIGAGIGALVVIVAVAAVTRAVRGRRRRKEQLWYRAHVQWTTASNAAAALTERNDHALPAASVRLVLRDTSASSCQLEEAPNR